jgi:translocation and assembly module TamB
MRRRPRAIFVVPGSLLTALILTIGFSLFIVRTSGFKRQIRSRVVSSLERATGGRVELGPLRFRWSTLTAGLDNLVIHGTEPVGSPPLLQVASIGIQLKAASLLKQKIDFSSVVAERPRAYLLVRADGSTNIPTPHLDRQDVIDQLVDFAVERFVFNHGTLSINQKSYPLSVSGQDLHALASYDRGQAVYHLGLSAHHVSVAASCCRDLPLSLDIQALAGKTAIDVRDANIISGASTLHVSGTLQHFNQPQADFQFGGDLEARQTAQFAKLATVRGGNILLKGWGRFDLRSGFTMGGDLRARRLAYRSSVLTLSDLDLASGFRFANGSLLLNGAAAKAFGGHFDGDAKLDTSAALQLSGRLANINLQQLAASFKKRIPWSGVATGQLWVNGRLASLPHNLVFHSMVQIAPARGGIPISGSLDLSKTGISGIRFGSSQLAVAGTQASFQGTPGTGIKAVIDTTNLADVTSILDFLQINHPANRFAVLLPGGSAHFAGTFAGSLSNPLIQGSLVVTRLEAGGERWNQLHAQGTLTRRSLDCPSLTADGVLVHASGSGHVELYDWEAVPNAPFRLHASFSGIDVPLFLSRYTTARLPVEHGTASGTLDVSGSIQQPVGNARITITSLAAFGEEVERLEAAAVFSANDLRIQHGYLERTAGGRIAFSGLYTHLPGDWQDGHLSARTDGGDLPVKNFKVIRTLAPDLTGDAYINAQFTAEVVKGSIHLSQIAGHTAVHNLFSNGIQLGSINADVETRSQTLNFSLQGNLRDSYFHGSAQVGLVQDAPVTGELLFDRISLITLKSLVRPERAEELRLEGFLNGGVEFQGSLAHPSSLRSTIRIDRLQLTSLLQPDFDLYNQQPIVLDVSGGKAAIRSFELLGKDTKFSVSGSAGYSRTAPLSLEIEGSVDLRVLELFDPNLDSSGHSLVKASVAGTLGSPTLKGRLELNNASLVMRNFANGLSAVNGVVMFNENRATIERLTATSGGGLLRVGGFVSYGGSGPLVYHIDARADTVRLRYASVSVTANTDLRLTGTSTSSVLSGSATVSRIVFNANTDIGNVLSGFAAPVPTPANQKDLLTGLHLDIGIESPPDLQISTALSRDVEAGIDLRLRGTPDRPVLLGSVSANQGDIRAFGTRYSINRGQISFINTSKVEPVLDLDLQTRARGITVDVTISGTLNHLNIAYRSDPPLQPRDIIALLTVGRTPQEASNVQTTQAATDTSNLQPGANSVLGQAMVPASGLSKLFGITNIKLDPLVQGISNTTQSRLTLEQQVSRAITVTYVTNLEQTSEQIFRIEWSMNPQYSVVAVRDDNGEFGVDIQYKKRFK